MDKIVIVSAVWCPSCLLLKKHIKNLLSEYDLDILLLDYDLDEEAVKELNVGDILPVIIYKDKRLIGEKTYEQIVNFLKENKVI